MQYTAGQKSPTLSLPRNYVPVNSKTAHPPRPPPPPRPKPRAFDFFLKNFGQIPCYVASLEAVSVKRRLQTADRG